MTLASLDCFRAMVSEKYDRATMTTKTRMTKQ
jgi:hypothetical protein